MVLFDLNNIRETAVTAPTADHHASVLKGDVLAAVKSVKRLSAYPWPFSVKTSADQHSTDYPRLSQSASSFVT